MNIRTYPEMNEKIVSLLRLSEDPLQLYAAQLIEELLTEKKQPRDEKLSDLIQHVGYDDAQLGREK